jgi:hypothetical protein
MHGSPRRAMAGDAADLMLMVTNEHPVFLPILRGVWHPCAPMHP